MIAITKDESQVLRKRFKKVCIVRLCKQKSRRHHYLVEEQHHILEAVAQMRNCRVQDLIQY